MSFLKQNLRQTISNMGVEMIQNSNKSDKSAESLKVVVVGASAAGLKAACRIRRLLPNAEVTVVEQGEYISYAACGLPYFLSGDIENFDALRKTPYDFIKNPEYFKLFKDVNVRTQVRALKIDREKQELLCKSVDTDNTFSL